jgi:hypothetical protein
MGATLRRICFLFAAASFVLPIASTSAQKKTKHPKPPDPKVENYYGGVFLVGEGEIPHGPCFRINGRITSGDFFNQLKAYEGDDGTVFRLGTNEVTQFPDKVLLSLSIRDQPCSFGLQPVIPSTYLTKEIMNSLKLTLYWKHGVELRTISKISVIQLSADPIQPYAKDLAEELPKRYLWLYELGVPATGIPLTDSLVLIFRTPDGHIVARVAARLLSFGFDKLLSHVFSNDQFQV